MREPAPDAIGRIAGALRGLQALLNFADDPHAYTDASDLINISHLIGLIASDLETMTDVVWFQPQGDVAGD